MTGAGNGIGRAIAQALVGEGVRTVFADVSEERVTAAVKASARPELAVPWVGDLADPAAREALLARRAVCARAGDAFRPLAPRRRGARPTTPWPSATETWAQMHAVNLEAGFHLSRELARELIAAKEPGSFLLLTSLHAGTPRNLPHYSTAKAGHGDAGEGAGQDVRPPRHPRQRAGARRDCRRRLRRRSQLAKHIPLGRLGQAEDLAPMALAVLSNRVSAYVTGAAIVVDGGLSLTNWFEPPEI